MRGFGPGLGDNTSAIIDAYANSFPEQETHRNFIIGT